jgi:hypothetical protein
MQTLSIRLVNINSNISKCEMNAFLIEAVDFAHQCIRLIINKIKNLFFFTKKDSEMIIHKFTYQIPVGQRKDNLSHFMIIFIQSAKNS